MIAAAGIPLADISWRGAVRIIRSVFPPIDLFEDIADPADWPLLISAEQKTNPRLMETIGNLDLVPRGSPRRRAGRQLSDGAVHPCQPRPAEPVQQRRLWRALCRRPFRGGAARDHPPSRSASWRARKSRPAGPRSSASSCSMSRPGCTICAAMPLTRQRSTPTITLPARRSARSCAPPARTASPIRACAARAAIASGCSIPDLAANPVQGRHLDYHWDGTRVDLYRDAGAAKVFRIV